MKWCLKNKYFIGITSFLLTALIMFVSAQLIIPDMTVNADDDNSPEKTEFWTVTSPEEASSIAGFPAATVSLVPDDLEKLPYYIVYEVRKGAWEIAQQWGTPRKGPVLGIVQSRYGNMSGEELTPFTYKNISGVKYFVPMKGDEAGRIDLFWRNGDIGYYMYANLTGYLDENTVMEIASSIVVNK